MWFKLSQVRLELDYPEADLSRLIETRLNLKVHGIKQLKILKKSLDARQRDPFFVYTVLFEVDLTDYEAGAILEQNHHLTIYQPELNNVSVSKTTKVTASFRPVIVGAGPAGLFAGYRLALAGLKPIIIDRGDGLVDRISKIKRFWQAGELDPESNIQYGIGGAGTFSDGKLTTRIKDPGVGKILETLVELGGPPEILYWQSPHIGTDLLREVIGKLQQAIIEQGGEFRFRSRFTDFEAEKGGRFRIIVNDAETLETGLLFLAIGNSARDVFGLLRRKGLNLVAKPFAVGFRIEHPQEIINKAQYGKWSNHPQLGPAEYRLTYQHPGTGRGVYSFCMCPGGLVIGAASEPGGVVTNGMSYHRRDSGIANAAIIVTVNEKDYGNQSPLNGVEWQQKIEAKAFALGGGQYFAPVQRVGDYLKKEATSSWEQFKPTYLPGTTGSNLWELLPEDICQAIADGIRQFGRQLKGFDWPEAILTGVETRTSSPVRIIRNGLREAEGFPGIYPIGEGAGYAGGIISSALDGWKTAEAVVERLSSC